MRISAQRYLCGNAQYKIKTIGKNIKKSIELNNMEQEILLISNKKFVK